MISSCCKNCGKPAEIEIGPVNDVVNASLRPACDCRPLSPHLRGFNVWWPKNPEIHRAWLEATPGLLFDIAFGCLARSPLRKMVSVHDFRELMVDVQDTIRAMGYDVGRAPQADSAEQRQQIRREVAAIAERFGRPKGREAELTIALFGLLDVICAPPSRSPNDAAWHLRERESQRIMAEGLGLHTQEGESHV